jgi:cytochrome c-type biogenesis protein CcmH/NrfF
MQIVYWVVPLLLVIGLPAFLIVTARRSRDDNSSMAEDYKTDDGTTGMPGFGATNVGGNTGF